MPDLKTLQLRAPSETGTAPALKKKSRGGEISAERLDALHEQACEIGRFVSPAHTAMTIGREGNAG